MKKILLAFLLISNFSFAQNISIIPRPNSMQAGAGGFPVDREVRIMYQASTQPSASFLHDYLLKFYQVRSTLVLSSSFKPSDRAIILADSAASEGMYTLKVSPGQVVIKGGPAGVFYGVQSFIQLLPVGPQGKVTTRFQVPSVFVKDSPRFVFRGMHLDVGRHFFPPDFVKKYIDFLALHKMNYFHWHLTEDQGWRIEIKRYPELTSTGAYRNGTIVGRYPGRSNDNKRYGGFYTQDEVRDIVKYAAARYITVIPEIEMPGHSSAAIASYPWLSCFPEKPTVIPTHPSEASVLSQKEGRAVKLVQETWGVFDDVYCAGKDSTFEFLQNVLDEIIPLFPSPLVHIGGDECPKTNWKKCPLCQRRIRENGLKDEHQLQSYFIKRIAKYLGEKGKTIMGWDEILEGGLSGDALVSNWRGVKWALQAAREGKGVIMSPENPLYLNFSQTRNEDSLVIGGYNPIESVYSFEPVPADLEPTMTSNIFGAQGNVWTEYMENTSIVEYMIFPRISALSEVQWTGQSKKSWGDFEKRLQTQFLRYDLWKVHYSNALYDIRDSISTNGKEIIWSLRSNSKYEIRAGSKKKQPNDTLLPKYIQALRIGADEQASAILYDRSTKRIINRISRNFYFSKATGRKVTIAKAPNGKYSGQGAFSLVNGIYSNKGLSFPDWLGWIGEDLDATIDLGRMDTVRSVALHTLDQNGSWIYLPKMVEVMVSDDGKEFRPAGSSSEFVGDTLTMGWITVKMDPVVTRYVRVVARNYGLIPDGSPGAGTKAWVFGDEILVK
jgi:hexosaminidase